MMIRPLHSFRLFIVACICAGMFFSCMSIHSGQVSTGPVYECHYVGMVSSKESASYFMGFGGFKEDNMGLLRLAKEKLMNNYQKNATHKLTNFAVDYITTTYFLVVTRVTCTVSADLYDCAKNTRDTLRVPNSPIVNNTSKVPNTPFESLQYGQQLFYANEQNFNTVKYLGRKGKKVYIGFLDDERNKWVPTETILFMHKDWDVEKKCRFSVSDSVVFKVRNNTTGVVTPITGTILALNYEKALVEYKTEIGRTTKRLVFLELLHKADSEQK